MPVDTELGKLLNLLNANPSFVSSESGAITKVESIPPDAGLVMVAGETRLRNGTIVATVFEVDANGGEIHGVYWNVEDRWHSSSDEVARRLVARSDAEIFPFDWKLAVPLDVSSYDSDPPESHDRPLP